MFTYICGVSRLHIISQSYFLVVLFVLYLFILLGVATAEPCHATIQVERPKDQYNQYLHGTLVQFGADETTGGSVWLNRVKKHCAC